MKISKQQLQKAIETVRPGLSNKEIIEQATSFIFQGGKVITYNDKISVSHPVEGLNIEGAIKAEEFYRLLGKLKEDEIDIGKKNNEIHLKSGRSRASFTLTQEIRLPFKDEIGEVSEWKRLPDEFNRLVKFAAGSCSSNAFEPIFTCVHVDEQGYLEGTDSYQIARCHLDGKMPIETFLIPADSVSKVLKIKPVYITSTQGWVHFSNDEGTIVSTRIYQEEYKDLSPFMKVEGTEVKFPASIISSIEKASIFAERDSALDEQIEVDLMPEKLKISGQSDTGKFEEEAPIQYEGNEISFTIAPYLLLNIFQEQETNQCVIGENALKFQGEDWEYVSVLQNKKEE